MSGYIGINLQDILNDEDLGENVAKDILSSYSCPLNPDVEDFLKRNAVEFAKQRISSTYIVMASYKGEYVLVGYFALATKVLCVHRDSLPNKKWRRRLARFGQYDEQIKKYTIPAPLIGQLGKNYTNGYNCLITGDELLYLALQKIRKMQYLVGGKIVYLECEDKEVLKDFYSQNGFVNFGTRKLEQDEKSKLTGDALVQMLKYLD